MTEQEWLACTDPDAMRRLLPDPPTDRKLRLFACACCRKFWDQLEDGTELVRVAERFADGLASEDELVEAGLPASHELTADAFGHLLSALECLLDPDAINSTGAAVSLAVWMEMRQQQQIRREHPKEYGPEVIRAAGEQAGRVVRREQCALLHDLFGNPFSPVTFDAAWRTPPVIALAQTIYDRRSYANLPRLAAALENAGCGNADILSHCRSERPHVRGCWVVDALLGKE
jgi:hypothetical protein